MSRFGFVRGVCLLVFSVLALARSEAAPRWLSAETAHFSVHTDTTARQAGDVAERLEIARAALQRWFAVPGMAAAAVDADLDIGPMEALVFADETRYAALLGSDTAAGYVTGPAPGRSFLVINHSAQDDLLQEALVRGLAYRFVRRRYPRLPSWLADGVAIYLGTTSARAGRILVGGLPLAYREQLGDVLPASQLFALSDATRNAPAKRVIDATAWALIDCLLDERVHRSEARQRLQAWLALVTRSTGTAAEVHAAFVTVYPELSLAALDDALAGHARRSAGTRAYRQLADDFLPPAVTVHMAPAAMERVEVLTAAVQGTAGETFVARERAARQAWLREGHNLLRFETNPLAVPGLFGLTYGRSFGPGAAADFELGWGPFGLTTGARHRSETRFGPGLFWDYAFGPGLAFKSEALGLTARNTFRPGASESQTYYHLSLNGELGFGVYTGRGVSLRLSGVALVPLLSNMDLLCRNERYRDNDECKAGGRFPPLSQLALAGIAFFRIGAGYAW